MGRPAIFWTTQLQSRGKEGKEVYGDERYVQYMKWKIVVGEMSDGRKEITEYKKELLEPAESYVVHDADIQRKKLKRIRIF